MSEDEIVEINQQIEDHNQRINNIEARMVKHDELSQVRERQERADAQIDSLFKMLTEAFKAFGELQNENRDLLQKVLDSKPLVVSKTVTDHTTQKSKAKTRSVSFEPGTYIQKVKGILASTPQVREVNTNRGPVQVTDFDFDIDDEIVKVTLWEQLGEDVVFKKQGASLTLTGMSVKPPYQDKPQLSSTRNTTVN